MKPIFAIFWDFDGVVQVISNNALSKKAWISSWLAGALIDCVAGKYPAEIYCRHPGVTAYLLQRYPRLRLPNREFVFGTNPQALSQILGDNHTSTPVNANRIDLACFTCPTPALNGRHLSLGELSSRITAILTAGKNPDHFNP